MKRFRAAVLGSCVLACSAEHSAQRAAGPSVPLTVQTAGAPESVSEGAMPEPFRLEDFTPILSRPEFAAVASALESEDAPAAARKAERVLAKSPPGPADVPRFQFLLGRLRESAGDLRGASASYQLAASTPWALSGYAHLGAGRCLLRAGYPVEALAELKRVPGNELAGGEARLLIAEAATLAADHALAVETFRAHLAQRPEPSDWAVTSLRLAAALIGRYDGIARRDVPAARSLSTATAEEVLTLTRAVAARVPQDKDAAAKAQELSARALELLPPVEKARWMVPSLEEQLSRLQALADARNWSEALYVAGSLLSQVARAERWSAIGCEGSLLRAKALAGNRQWGKAADDLGDVVRQCRDSDVVARALYLTGKYSDSDKRYARAIRAYEELERRFPGHRLADDARLRAAFSHLELGAEARFTELLTRMPDDYPEGDMVLDGVFELSLRRFAKGDFGSALRVLERGAALAGPRDRLRGQEYSGRERYFLARARSALGEKEPALAEYEAILTELPMSYYMLHAYARLHEADPERAARARSRAIEVSSTEPFSFERRPELEQPGFLRALELLRQGEIELGRRELDALGLPSADAAPQVLWAVALLYARAGSAKLSHAVARGLLTDWLSRWPAGDWSKAWELAFPRPYRAIVQAEAKKNNLVEHLVYAIIREESAFEPAAVSPADAYGLMQLIEPTARHVARDLGLPSHPDALKRPPVNIALGCRFLGQLVRSFPENILLAIPAYNAGPGRPRRWVKERPDSDFDVWVELIPFTETRRYTKRVLASRAAYAYLYEPGHAEAALLLPAKVSR